MQNPGAQRKTAVEAVSVAGASGQSWSESGCGRGHGHGYCRRQPTDRDAHVCSKFDIDWVCMVIDSLKLQLNEVTMQGGTSEIPSQKTKPDWADWGRCTMRGGGKLEQSSKDGSVICCCRLRVILEA